MWNIADHGADGTAANDNLALANGIAYAAARGSLGTHIVVPVGLWQFSVTNTPFNLPSYTTLEGMDEKGTVFAWNDTTANTYLFSGSTASRQSNVTFRNFTVKGSWTQPNGGTNSAGTVGYGSGQGPIFLLGFDGLYLDHITSLYSHGYGISVRNSSDAHGSYLTTKWSRADAINFEDTTNWTLDNFVGMHTADDCISGHSDPYDVGGVRRNIAIRTFSCIDSSGVNIASPRSVVIADGIIDSFHGNAMTLATSGTTAGEGQTSGNVVSVSHLNATNCIARDGMDGVSSSKPNGYPTGCNIIVIYDQAARAGSYNGIPGEPTGSNANGTATNVHGGIIDPYPEFLSNSGSNTQAVADTTHYFFDDVTVGRAFPAANGSDSRFKTFSDFKQGCIQLSDGCYDVPLPEGQFMGDGVVVDGGRMVDVTLTNSHFFGLTSAFYAPYGGLNAFWTIAHNDFFDMASTCVDIEGSAVATYDIEDNTCVGDPYSKSPNRGGSGNWNSNGLTGFVLSKATSSGGILKNNKLWDVSEDFDINPSDPASRWLVSDNIDFANPTAVDSFTNQSTGIGYVHSVGTRLVQVSGTPGASNYLQILNTPIDAAPSMPTSGFWKPGDFVRNSAWSSSNTALGWLRVTLSNNGGYAYSASTNNTAGTDWIVK